MTEFFRREFRNATLSATSYPDNNGVLDHFIDFTQGFEGVQFALDDIDDLIEGLQEIREIAENEGYI